MKKPKLLLVDDSKPILRLLEVLLKSKYETFAASSVLAALNWLNDHNIPDLIITDIQMPSIDGVEFITHLGNSVYYRSIPILIISGYDNEEISDRCDKLTVEGFLTKPFDPVELRNMVDKALKEADCSKTV